VTRLHWQLERRIRLKQGPVFHKILLDLRATRDQEHAFVPTENWAREQVFTRLCEELFRFGHKDPRATLYEDPGQNCQVLELHDGDTLLGHYPDNEWSRLGIPSVNRDPERWVGRPSVHDMMATS
jgi:hypothetical protein